MLDQNDSILALSTLEAALPISTFMIEVLRRPIGPPR